MYKAKSDSFVCITLKVQSLQYNINNIYTTLLYKTSYNISLYSTLIYC